MTNSIKDALSQPGKYRPVAAWAMNDRLEKRKLTGQLKSFRYLGYGGVMVIPWGGLPNQFMDDQWLDAVEHILGDAEKLGLDVWIWDDWCFPSGFGGGEVTKTPEFRAKKLKLVIDVVLEPGEKFSAIAPQRSLAAGYFPVDKFNNPSGEITNIRINPQELINHTAGNRERLVVVGWDYVSSMQHTVTSHANHGPKATWSIYSHDDRSAFSVDMLHPGATRRYLDLIHEKYLKKCGRFFGKTLKGFFYDEPVMPGIFPWNQLLPQKFLQVKGYDLRDVLIKVVLDYKLYDIVFDELKPADAKKARADYMDVWTSMVEENFYGAIQDWCRAHGIISTGHQTGDENLTDIVCGSGMFFKIMSRSDMPGVDVIFRQVEPGKFNDAPRLAGSRRILQKQPFAVSESLAVMGTSMHTDLIRYISEYQVVRGINKFFYKLSNYNPVKDRYFHPPEMSAANPVVKNYGRPLFERTSQICSLASEGEFARRICVYIPPENYYMGNKAVGQDIEALAKNLVFNQYEFDYAWDKDFEKMDVEKGRFVGIPDIAYDCILVPPNACFSEEIRQRFLYFAEKGGRIFFCPPADSSASKIGTLVKGIDDINKFCGAFRNIRIEPAGAPISVMTRRFGKTYLYFLLNETEKSHSVTLIPQKQGRFGCLDILTGEIFSIGARTNIPLTFLAMESKIIVADPERKIQMLPAIKESGQEIPLQRWTLVLPDGRKKKLCQPLPSWNDIGYGGYTGFMRYRTNFSWKVAASYGILSLGRVCYAATVYLDGIKICDSIFTPHRIILKGLKKGAHTLEIDVLNTPANEIIGDEHRFQRLEKKGFFNGTYAPIYVPIDRERLTSGLLGPVKLSLPG